MGIVTRALRIIVGVALTGYALKLGFPESGRNWAGWIGAVPLSTAFVGICPLYSLLGVNIYSRRETSNN